MPLSNRSIVKDKTDYLWNCFAPMEQKRPKRSESHFVEYFTSQNHNANNARNATEDNRFSASQAGAF